jgi:hypothetical protein
MELSEENISKRYVEEKIPGMLMDRNFLKEYRFYSYVGWKHVLAQIFSKLLLGQCDFLTTSDHPSDTSFIPSQNSARVPLS